MKIKFTAQSVTTILAASLLMALSSAVMAKSVETQNPFDTGDMNTANLVMSSDHDHDNDADKKGHDESKDKDKEEDKKSSGKCGADHMEKSSGKCGGN